MTHYFGDKRQLVKDVIAWQAQSTLQQHHAPDLGQLDTFAALRLWADLHIERQLQRDGKGGCSFGSLAGQLVESDPEARDDLASGFTEWLALFRHGLSPLKRAGGLGCAPAPQVP